MRRIVKRLTRIVADTKMSSRLRRSRRWSELWPDCFGVMFFESGEMEGREIYSKCLGVVVLFKLKIHPMIFHLNLITV